MALAIIHPRVALAFRQCGSGGNRSGVGRRRRDEGRCRSSVTSAVVRDRGRVAAFALAKRQWHPGIDAGSTGGGSGRLSR